MINDPEQPAEPRKVDPEEGRRYEKEQFDFCPQKDLNLPGSYDEVVERFKRLQGDRAWEVLN